jgi:hypothetical protein
MEFIEKQKIAQEQTRIQKIGAAGLWSIFVIPNLNIFIYSICNQFVCIVYSQGFIRVNLLFFYYNKYQ